VVRVAHHGVPESSLSEELALRARGLGDSIGEEHHDVTSGDRHALVDQLVGDVVDESDPTTVVGTWSIRPVALR